MRRDMDLVREILIACSKSPDGCVDASVLADARHPFDVVAYHVDIMMEAGLVHGVVQHDCGGGIALAQAGPLTWEGNEFLDTVASDSVWKQVKVKLGETVKTTTIDVVKSLAVKLTQQALGL